ncbi:MAG: HPr-rel-A system PqqD family peptide chaperone [Methyloprofundus sp.]|nr:HPr-rel-A system PqqD family peptide chaperone [Methyloprofundus sp.]
MSWSVPEQAKLSIQIWGDTAVIYYSLSGQTHLLNGLACEVLQLLQASPETISTLISKLGVIFEVEDKADLRLQLQKLASEFETLGLIESTQCEN